MNIKKDKEKKQTRFVSVERLMQMRKAAGRHVVLTMAVLC